MSLLTDSLPGSGVECVYLFIARDSVKVGRTANMAQRTETYYYLRLGHWLEVDDSAQRERELLSWFKARFTPARPMGVCEWFLISEETACYAFEEWAGTLLESDSQLASLSNHPFPLESGDPVG